jgi:hypothetical protein
MPLESPARTTTTSMSINPLRILFTRKRPAAYVTNLAAVTFHASAFLNQQTSPYNPKGIVESPIKGKNKDLKPEKSAGCSRMYPSLHDAITDAVSEHIGATRFHDKDSNKGSIKQYSTFVMGLFTCRNHTCTGGAWRSGKITILIRKYPDNGYNAVVYYQRCKLCNRLGQLKLDKESYVDRISYRLKKWADIPMEPPKHTSKETPPHLSHLCEGCKRGICPEVAR